jgi:hypothetical protein
VSPEIPVRKPFTPEFTHHPLWDRAGKKGEINAIDGGFSPELKKEDPVN